MNLSQITRTVGVGAFAAAGLVGCDSTEMVKMGEASASFRCLQLAATQLGLASSQPMDGEATNPMSFRFVSTGQFVTRAGSVKLAGAAKPSEIICTGDFNRRTISSLQVDGTISRPAKPEDWVFE